jgi:hypothetical protein
VDKSQNIQDEPLCKEIIAALKLELEKFVVNLLGRQIGGEGGGAPE